MKFDRDVFFKEYHSRFGLLIQNQVDALNELLPLVENDADLTDLRQVSYILGTIRHESASTFKPITERGAREYFNKYEPGRKLAKQLGNTQPGDGYRFRGRGFVQVTGRANYTKLTRAYNDTHPTDSPISFVDLPDLFLQPGYSWFAILYGMRTGLFTGVKLLTYISEHVCNYKLARQVVNGFDRSELIAGYAMMFEKILIASRVPIEVVEQ